MNRKQTSAAIRNALEQSQCGSVFVKNGCSFRLYFEYRGETVTICPPNSGCICLLIAPDQADSDLIVVSTDSIRLPKEMDSDTIAERLLSMNEAEKERGIKYNAYPYHCGEGFNRAVWVIKQFKAIDDDNVLKALPAVIEDVLCATVSFMKRFNAFNSQ